MTPTIFQPAELRDSNDNIIQHGAYGKNTPLANATNDAWIDFVMNNLEYLNKGQDAFEYDSNSDLMPVANPVASLRWDTDGNGDIMPV
jgi:hypothetical protein